MQLGNRVDYSIFNRCITTEHRNLNSVLKYYFQYYFSKNFTLQSLQKFPRSSFNFSVWIIFDKYYFSKILPSNRYKNFLAPLLILVSKLFSINSNFYVTLKNSK